jgi:hypothetical protein
MNKKILVNLGKLWKSNKIIVEMKTTSIKNNCGNENYIHKKIIVEM